MVEHYKNLSLDNIVEEIDGVIYTEEWIPIKEFEGKYSVSSFGRIKSHKRESLKEMANGAKYTTINQEIILRHKFNNRRYHMVGLSGLEKIRYLTVHRLVGLHFIGNPQNKRTINHKFGNKDDNRMWSLEWATDSEQGLHAYRELGRKRVQTYLGKFGKDHNKSKPLIQYSLDGDFIRGWENAQQVQRELGFTASNISSSCTGRKGHNEFSGFLWRFINDEKPLMKSTFNSPVIQLSDNGNFIKEYESLREAGRQTGFDRSHIGKSVKNNKLAYGFKWQYK